MLIYRLLVLVHKRKRILDRDNVQYLNRWFRHSISTNELQEYQLTSHLLSTRQRSRLFLRLKYPNRQYRLIKRHCPLFRLSTFRLRLLVLPLVLLPLLMLLQWFILFGTMKLCRHYHLVKGLHLNLDDSTCLPNYHLCHLVPELLSDKSDLLPSPQRLERLIHPQQPIYCKWTMSSLTYHYSTLATKCQEEALSDTPTPGLRRC
jgi:hypothetical protein